MAGNLGIGSERSGAPPCRIQSSELCLLLELGPSNYSYCSSYPERCCGFPALSSSCREGYRAGNHRNRFRDIRR
eukprot:7056431-Pyramimonas_sp.AAC.1